VELNDDGNEWHYVNDPVHNLRERNACAMHATHLLCRAVREDLSMKSGRLDGFPTWRDTITIVRFAWHSQASTDSNTPATTS
jgi:hypothetical protein